MPRYEIQITELPNQASPPVEDQDPAPDRRDLVTVQDAPNEDRAKAWAWRVWDAKYGPSGRPDRFRLGIERLDIDAPGARPRGSGAPGSGG